MKINSYLGFSSHIFGKNMYLVYLTSVLQSHERPRSPRNRVSFPALLISEVTSNTDSGKIDFQNSFPVQFIFI